MPSATLRRTKLASCYDQKAFIIQQLNSSIVEKKVECMKLLQAPVKGSIGLSPASLHFPPTESVGTVTHAGMSSTSIPNLSQGHPIDELTSEPVDPFGRSNQHLLPGSNHSSSDFGPFVSGVSDEFRQRSSSFNTSLSRGQPRPQYGAGAVGDRRTRFGDSNTRSGSADNVAFTPHQPQLRHSHTVPEIPAHALSNDSGYHTPPNRQHGQTSPPWQYSYHGSQPLANRTSAPLPLNQNLTIETSGHYQPEPSTPQIVVGQPIMYAHSMPPPLYGMPSYPRTHDPHSSLHSQGSTPQTPEEGICGYQRERKNRLVNAFQAEEAELTQLNMEEEQLHKQFQTERESNSGFDIRATEREVQSMTNENKKLGVDIQRLYQLIPTAAPPSRFSTPLTPGYPPSLLTCPDPNSGYPTPVARPIPVVVPPRPVTYPDVSLQTAPLPVPAYNDIQMINNPVQATTATSTVPPTAAPRRVPPRPTPPPPAGDEQWSCASCTLLNHPLITSCEACEAPRPRPGNTTPTNGLVKKSSCQHQSGCFCHAHLS